MLHDDIERKFVDFIETNEWEIETDEGWSSIKGIGKTVPYQIYYIKTELGKELKCADTHILFDSDFNEIFVKDLQIGTEIITKDNIEKVVEIKVFEEKVNMYDIQVDDENHRYYTNGILSHNSIYLCNEAAHFVKNGYNVLFVTCEMSEQKVLRRIGSNLLNIGMDEYVNKSRDVELIKKKLKKVGNGLMPHGKLWIKEYPTSTATPFDIECYLKKFNETHDYKIDVVIVDYLGIMASNRNNSTDNMYLKNKVIAEDLRALAVKYDLLVVTAMQINRGSGWDNTDMKMEDIAESAGIPATADTMLGIIQDAIMYTNQEYWLKLLKVRDGEGKNRKCKLKIDYNYMRLIETDEIID